jgi:hypothetical protein
MEEMRSKVDMQNNETHVVFEVGADTFKTRSSRNGVVREWGIEDFHENFRVGYCMTVHKAQGDTIHVLFCMWECRRMSKRHVYTAITRATGKTQIRLGLLPAGMGNAKKMRERMECQKKVQAYKASDLAKGRPVCDQTEDDMLADLEECGRHCFHCGEEVKVVGTRPRDPLMATWDRYNYKTGGHVRDNTYIAHLKCNEGHKYEMEPDQEQVGA